MSAATVWRSAQQEFAFKEFLTLLSPLQRIFYRATDRIIRWEISIEDRGQLKLHVDCEANPRVLELFLSYACEALGTKNPVDQRTSMAAFLYSFLPGLLCNVDTFAEPERATVTRRIFRLHAVAAAALAQLCSRFSISNGNAIARCAKLARSAKIPLPRLGATRTTFPACLNHATLSEQERAIVKRADAALFELLSALGKTIGLIDLIFPLGSAGRRDGELLEAEQTTTADAPSHNASEDLEHRAIALLHAHRDDSEWTVTRIAKELSTGDKTVHRTDLYRLANFVAFWKGAQASRSGRRPPAGSRGKDGTIEAIDPESDE